jgi:hypothetical protein
MSYWDGGAWVVAKSGTNDLNNSGTLIGCLTSDDDATFIGGDESQFSNFYLSCADYTTQYPPLNT